ncbi:MAG: hypothetical protein A4E57_02172 [Syntrophorhabdaceae bacterium PtaU1.Bin034]|nr:MAG: hypothetical protein A4E57_02172 [Syntrophorhabdaceae bacterium PtaU1.Bin034]
MAAIFKPPAALLLAYLPCICFSSMLKVLISSERALFNPMVMSVSTVVGAWARPKMTSFAKSTAITFV